MIFGRNLIFASKTTTLRQDIHYQLRLERNTNANEAGTTDVVPASFSAIGVSRTETASDTL